MESAGVLKKILEKNQGAIGAKQACHYSFRSSAAKRRTEALLLICNELAKNVSQS